MQCVYVCCIAVCIMCFVLVAVCVCVLYCSVYNVFCFGFSVCNGAWWWAGRRVALGVAGTAWRRPATTMEASALTAASPQRARRAFPPMSSCAAPLSSAPPLPPPEQFATVHGGSAGVRRPPPPHAASSRKHRANHQRNLSLDFRYCVGAARGVTVVFWWCCQEIGLELVSMPLYVE